jgi:hypothetical protein
MQQQRITAHHFVGREGHGGTVDNAPAVRHPGIVCDCGEWFRGTRHPVEPDLIECPAWERHVKQARS